MTLQTTYTSQSLQLGRQATTLPASILSRVIEGAAVAFGKVVVRGANDLSVKLPAADATAYVGFALMDATQPSTVVNGYDVGAVAAIITKGDIVVTAGEAVNDGDPVYFVNATGALLKTSGAGNTLIAGAVWDSTAASGALAVIRLG